MLFGIYFLNLIMQNNLKWTFSKIYTKAVQIFQAKVIIEQFKI